MKSYNSRTTIHELQLFDGIYSNRKVMVTGHTGFKGSYLVYWLLKMGAEVCGYSLESPTKPNHFELLKLNMRSVIGDIRDKEKLQKEILDFSPEIVFHLAAQPLVRLSYKEPVTTFETNVLGTVNVLESCRHCESLKAIVSISSDKCYENREWIWGYRENDPMGGYDPYSASKGCAELATTAYRNSFFNLNDFGEKHNVLLASCRAGNVIGGGDWAEDRLIPDIMKATALEKIVDIRNPNATRPWQHVLEPLSGYLLIGQKLLGKKKEFAESWNFGPGDRGNVTVREVCENISKHWNKIKFNINNDANSPHEANLLKLDCSKAHTKLEWREIWNSEETFKKTALWYKNFYKEGILNTDENLNSYIEDAQLKNVGWSIKFRNQKLESINKE